MQEEFKALQDKETWELVPLPSKRKQLVPLPSMRKLVQCKWVYRTNMVADGSYMKYKARLVSKFFSQFQGVDYTKTFSLVAKMDSIRLVLAIAASKLWDVHRMDVKNDFLHGDINEEIYIQKPKGFIHDPSLVL